MSRSAPKACARSQYTPMLAPEKGAVWSINYEERRTVNEWNKLSADCVHSCSVNIMFKNRIGRIP